MRKKVVAGNWKMNLDLNQGRNLVNSIISNSKFSDVEVIVIPPFTHLGEIKNALSGTKIKLGAQNVHASKEGAFTGEVSAQMLNSIGVDYCLVGHSERRVYQKESEVELNGKINRLIEYNIKPIYCVGESIEDRKSSKHFNIVESQLSIIKDLNEASVNQCIIAYEPVWAIGTGETATSDQAEEMHSFIRQLLESFHGKSIAESMPILYGGSCKPNNAKEIFSKPNVDGGLIGGASLNADDFTAIIEAHT